MDGTKNQQDTSGATQDTSGGEKGTSEKEPETYTGEQVQKEVSDALSKAGRDAKSLENRGKTLDAREQALTSREKAQADAESKRDVAELEAAEGNPELADVIKSKQQLKADRKQLEADRGAFDQEKTQYQELLDSAHATQTEIKIWDIAKEHGVDASELKDAVTELGLKTEEQIGSIAKRMAKAGGKPPKIPLKPDSSVTIGGGELPESARGKILKGFEERHK